MKSIYKTKKTLLSISNKKKYKALKLPSFVHRSFWGVIISGKYSMSFQTFLIVSGLISMATMFAYYLVFRNTLLSAGIALPSFFILYVLVSTNRIIENRLNYINEQRNFVDVLESELTATNATLEAVKNTAKHRLPAYLKAVIEDMVKRSQLGDSFEEIIDDVESHLPSNDLRMAFAILRINHKVGSSETINGLKEISKNLEHRGEYVLSFKEKMSGQVVEKTLFYMISLFAPILMEIYQQGYFSSLMGFVWGPWFLIIIFFISMGGQFLMENTIQKTLEEL